MKTQGIGVECGYLWFAAAVHQAVPPPFWSRLKHIASKAGLLDALTADYRSESAAVRAERQGLDWRGDQRIAEDDRERALFRRWVEKVVGPQALWPWQRGWTVEAVDSYLDTASASQNRSQGPSRGCLEVA